MRTYDHFICGPGAKGESGAYIERHSPADGRLVARFTNGTAVDVALAVEAARQAFDAGPWPRMSGLDRADVLRAFADRVLANQEYLADIETEEVGKPIRFSRKDIAGAARLIHYAAGLAADLHGIVYSGLRGGQTGLVLREPAGVAGLIIPWNFPAYVFCQKVPYALAAGCTLVVKPSEFTSGTALELARIAMEAGLPPGVLNVVTGFGDPAGEALTQHPGVDMVSFTGSTATGRRVLRNAAEGIKRVAVELGGKSANIVFADAKLDDAIDGALAGVYSNQGEVCCAGSRLLVEEGIADEFLARLGAAAARLIVGDPRDEATDIGALIHAGHMAKVEGYIDSGRQEGAQVVLGGSRLSGSGYDGGYFMAPTILDRVASGMTVFRDEIFGPVLGVTRFRSTDEAIAIANDTRYGLANALWTNDLDRAMHVTQALKSGVVWVNTIVEVAPQMPFGGVRESGFGREFGQAGLEEFTEMKSVFLTTGTRERTFGHA